VAPPLGLVRSDDHDVLWPRANVVDAARASVHLVARDRTDLDPGCARPRRPVGGRALGPLERVGAIASRAVSSWHASTIGSGGADQTGPTGGRRGDRGSARPGLASRVRRPPARRRPCWSLDRGARRTMADVAAGTGPRPSGLDRGGGGRPDRRVVV